MTRDQSAGRRPGAKRTARPGAKQAASPGDQRTRTTSPIRRTVRTVAGPPAAHATLTARAAILVLALAAVMVAVALPLKIWMGQRGDIASQTAQIRRAEVRVAQLQAQNKQWADPGYVEAQARQRLHYVVPGQKTYVVLGKSKRQVKAIAAHKRAAAASVPWYSQLWKSAQTAGAAPASP